MEIADTFYNKDEYVETASGNKVSRQTVLCGSQNIVLHGKVIIDKGRKVTICLNLNLMIVEPSRSDN